MHKRNTLLTYIPCPALHQQAITVDLLIKTLAQNPEKEYSFRRHQPKGQILLCYYTCNTNRIYSRSYPACTVSSSVLCSVIFSPLNHAMSAAKVISVRWSSPFPVNSSSRVLLLCGCGTVCLRVFYGVTIQSDFSIITVSVFILLICNI